MIFHWATTRISIKVPFAEISRRASGFSQLEVKRVPVTVQAIAVQQLVVVLYALSKSQEPTAIF